MQCIPFFRRISLLAVLVLLFCIIGFRAFPSAYAATGDQTCTATLKITFLPSLGQHSDERSALTEGEMHNCTSAQNLSPQLTSGIFQIEGALASSVPPRLCKSGPFGVTGKGKITWNTGQESEIASYIQINMQNETLAYEMKVISGPLQGDLAKVESVKASLAPGTCPTKYLSSVTSDPATLSFN